MTHILVIEDEQFILENITEILAMEDFEVKGARDGKTGVEMAMEFKPDLIVCDVAMPEMNGYDVLIELRSQQEMANVPFIFLTAKASRSDLRTSTFVVLIKRQEPWNSNRDAQERYRLQEIEGAPNQCVFPNTLRCEVSGD